jgi:hypothetical protein
MGYLLSVVDGVPQIKFYLGSSLCAWVRFVLGELCYLIALGLDTCSPSGIKDSGLL